MKPLPLAITLIVAGLLSWWLFAPDDGTQSPSGNEPLRADESARGGAEPAAGRASVPVEPVAQTTQPAQPPQPVPPARRKSILPLADKFIANATWSDESGAVVLQHLAEAAGKRLRISRGVRKRVEELRVTLKLGHTAVPQVLDAVLQPHTMTWQVENEYIVVYDNDD